ncbi:MAG: DUF4410 domain-containing protein [Methylobacter sp.]
MDTVKSFNRLIILIIALLTGCAHTGINNGNENLASGLIKPQRVLVYNFAVSPEDIRQNSSIFSKLRRNLSATNQTAEQVQLGREVADALATELTQKIAALGLNAQRAFEDTPVPPDSILVTGHFVNVDEGNRLRRNVIGLGMGQSSIDAQIQVLASPESGYTELTAFDAHTDSGHVPGIAVLGPAGAAAGAGTGAVVGSNAAITGAKSYRSASAQEAKRMADSISERLARYFARQGWIDPNLAK